MTQRLLENGLDKITPAEEGSRDSSILNQGCDNESHIQGYKKSAAKQLTVHIGYILSALILRLIFHWRPDWKLKCTHNQCSLGDADAVLIVDQYHQVLVHRVHVATETGDRVKLVSDSAGCLRACCAPDLHDIEEKDSGISQWVPQHHRHSGLIRYFYHKKVKYTWDRRTQKFAKIEIFADTPCSDFHRMAGMSEGEAAVQRVLFGCNRVHIQLTPILQLFLLKFINPLYMFQVFSVTLWFYQGYWMYATCIVVLSLLSLTMSVYEISRNERNLRKTLVSSKDVSVFRTGKGFQSISSELLVPGDVIEIPIGGCVMHCDAVLIAGNCIVNESMLTGESVPVLKTPLPVPAVSKRRQQLDLQQQQQQKRVKPEPIFSLKEHGKHLLYCGTRVIQTRYVEGDMVRAVVVRTGFMTAKGEMVRSILFPKPVEFKFNQDIVRYLIVLGLFAMAGFIYSVVLMSVRQYGVKRIIVRALDIISIVVPPALPSAMTVGIVFAQTRLRKSGIFCISPNQINVSGTLNVVCFDKTGTLTEDGLDLWGVLSVAEEPVGRFQFAQPVHKPEAELPCPGQLLEAMATCHTLTRIEGSLSGDPLDLKMFLATGWEFEEPERVDYKKFEQLVSAIVRPPRSRQSGADVEAGVQPYELGIVRQFAFSSSLQRMSVIVRRLDADHFTVFAKGSPEMVQSLCRPETVPANFQDCLMLYTRQGFRVIGLAARPLRVTYLKAQKISRESAEKDLNFLGLLVMENRLKPETTPVIDNLLAARIRPVMVTGDNLLTALSVARDCNIISDRGSVILVQGTPEQPPFPPQVDFHYAGDLRKKVSALTALTGDRDLEADIRSGDFHLAMTGRSWDIVRANFPQLIPKLIVKGTVFARFSPDQKAQLVEALQKVGYTVGMCGDGANDCGALKAAHAGISLSEAEASVASPFTSQRQNISCVPTLIREGRCALVTSFGIFKFMAGYSLAQFVSCIILYTVGCTLTDPQFLYIDLFLLTSLCVTFGYTAAHSRLSRCPPATRLISPATVASICTQSALNVSFQVLAFLHSKAQPWFYPNSGEGDYAGYETTSVFLMSSFQYIGMAILFSKSVPYRQRLFRNYFLLANVLVTLGVNTCVLFNGAPWLNKLLTVWDTPLDNPNIHYRFLIAGAALLNFLLAFVVEELIEGRHFRQAATRLHRFLNNGRAIKEFERVRAELAEQAAGAKEPWPQITRTSSCRDFSGPAEFARLADAAGDAAAIGNGVPGPMRRSRTASGPLNYSDSAGSDEAEDEDEATAVAPMLPSISEK